MTCEIFFGCLDCKIKIVKDMIIIDWYFRQKFNFLVKISEIHNKSGKSEKMMIQKLESCLEF